MANLRRRQFTVVDQAGNVVPFAWIEVKAQVGGTLLSLFSDRAGTTPIASNPFQADANGFAAYFAAGDVTHQVRAYLGPSGAPTFEKIHTYVADGTAAEYDIGSAASLLKNGTVSAPAVTFESDPDTGIYRIGANNLGIAAGGVKVVDLTASIISLEKDVVFRSVFNVFAFSSFGSGAYYNTSTTAQRFFIGTEGDNLRMWSAGFSNNALAIAGATGEVTLYAGLTVPGFLVLNDSSTFGALKVGNFGHIIGRLAATGAMLIGGGQDNIRFSATNPVAVLNTSAAAFSVAGASLLNAKVTIGLANAGAPIATGTANTTTIMRLQTNPGGGLQNVLDFGGYSGSTPYNFAMWLQVYNQTNLASYLPLALNPLGGEVYVGPGGLVGQSAGNFNLQAYTGQQMVFAAQGSSNFSVFNAASATWYPAPDNVISFGLSTQRWKAGFFGTDGVDTTGPIKSAHATGGIGYATGAAAGTNPTQATSKTTAVTANKVTGFITMHNASMAANSQVDFQFNNSAIAATDMLDVQLVGGYATVGTYIVRAEIIGAGVARVIVMNVSAGALGEALKIRFYVKKSVDT